MLSLFEIIILSSLLFVIGSFFVMEKRKSNLTVEINNLAVIAFALLLLSFGASYVLSGVETEVVEIVSVTEINIGQTTTISGFNEEGKFVSYNFRNISVITSENNEETTAYIEAFRRTSPFWDQLLTHGRKQTATININSPQK